MGGYSQPDALSGIENSLDGVDLNGLGIGTRRRSGWLAALLKIGPDSSPRPWDERLPSGSQGQSRLAHLMKHGESGGLPAGS